MAMLFAASARDAKKTPSDAGSDSEKTGFAHGHWNATGKARNRTRRSELEDRRPSSTTEPKSRRIGVVSLSNAVAASGTHNAMLGLRDFMDRKE
eukprot:g33720.t1